MGRFSDIVGGVNPVPQEVKTEETVDNIEEVVNQPEEVVEAIQEQELPVTSDDASDKNLLFSRKNYLKQFDPPPPPPKELNPGQELFRHKLLDKPEKSDVFVKKSLRAAKEPEKPWAPVNYDAPKSRMRRKK